MMNDSAEGKTDPEVLRSRSREYERSGLMVLALAAHQQHMERCTSLDCRLYEARLLQSCGNLAAAEEIALRVVAAATRSGLVILFEPPFVRISAWLRLARIRAERGRLEDAQSLESEAEALLVGCQDEARNEYFRRQLDINRYISALYTNDFSTAYSIAIRLLKEAEDRRNDHVKVADRVRLAVAALGLGDRSACEALLKMTDGQAREKHSVWLDTRRLILQAEVNAAEGNERDALGGLRKAVDDAEAAPYPELLAMAWNKVADVQAATGAVREAVDASLRALRAAWCNGPPFASHQQLEAAKAQLSGLGIAKPEGLPPFDAKQYPGLVANRF